MYTRARVGVIINEPLDSEIQSCSYDIKSEKQEPEHEQDFRFNKPSVKGVNWNSPIKDNSFLFEAGLRNWPSARVVSNYGSY